MRGDLITDKETIRHEFDEGWWDFLSRSFRSVQGVCGGGPGAKHQSSRTAEGLCEHIGRESCARWDELHVLHHCGMKSLMATKWVVDLVLISVKLKNIFSTFAEGCMVHVD